MTCEFSTMVLSNGDPGTIVQVRPIDEMGALRALPDVPFLHGDVVPRIVSRWALSRLVEAGHLERLGHGLYQKSEAAPVDVTLVEAAVRAPDATLCLVSALAHHGLIDEIPHAIDLAIPSGHRIPATTGPIRWHRFASESFAVGRQLTIIEGTQITIGIYSPERSIVDAYRLRQHAGYETADEALRTWLRRPDATPAKILAVADRLPRAQAPLRTALAYLA